MHHRLLKERDDLQQWFPAEEDLVGRMLPSVGLGDRSVEPFRCPDGGGKPQAGAIEVYIGDGAQVDAWVGEDLAARGMAAFERATDSALHDPFMLGRVRSGVLPTNVGGIEELGGLPTGDLAAVVRAKTSRSSHAAHIVQEMLDVLGCI